MIPSRTERVFAAFQGPVLSAGTSVVHMYRSYTLELLLPRRWRVARGLGIPDVVSALEHSEARSAVLPSPPLTCPKCGPVLTVSHPRAVTAEGFPDDLECYQATLRSHCTSSRGHLQCKAVVVAVRMRDTVVFSDPFAVFARKPMRQCKRKGMPGLHVIVEIWRVLPICETLPPAASDLIPGVAEALGQMVPGFVLQKSAIINAMAVFVRTYRTPDDAAQGCDVCARYTRNEIHNAVGHNMEGFAVLLARHSNC
eukprot:m51a1_g7046 hypothetical protein (254) ;mRNA; r:127604-128580